ncbi:hypothetical protein MtrunA17_Chr3g0110651 [Medicago truncatula]|uniref:Transmembrane protein n=1 Tax=Medicago truncatula TaxID=3880 RepID=A0A396IYU9_MEDTR|nr:hypothetical protein MtrunA17_Chr3g0110651 [Medicago truncatula]
MCNIAQIRRTLYLYLKRYIYNNPFRWNKYLPYIYLSHFSKYSNLIFQYFLYDI